MIIDKKFRSARKWSNRELKKFTHLMDGEIVNVSAYLDEDKEGKTYRQYFHKAASYNITNFDADKKGTTGRENEIYLDLEETLPKNLQNKFDLVFNHTTLEHVYEIQLAFKNLCRMSRDYLIVVVPFLQEQHAFYGDYWRVTPMTLVKMCENNGFSPIYLSANDTKGESVYIFLLARRGNHIPVDNQGNILHHVLTDRHFFIGKNAINNSIFFNLLSRIKRFLGFFT